MDETLRTEILQMNEVQLKRLEADVNARFAEVKSNRALDNTIRMMIVLWVATIVPLGWLLLFLYSSLR
ncbi:MAG: hypothetical protein ABIV11_10700 [Gemmatimonadaceae bacterium]